MRTQRDFRMAFLKPFLRSSLGLPIGAALTLFGGCVTLPDATRHASTIAVPDHWQQAADIASPSADELAQWWTRFNDPVLNQLVADALHSSPDIRTAVSRITESRARWQGERANLFPSVTAALSGQSSRSRNRSTGVVTEGESYQAGLDASWQTDLFGQQRLTISAAEADLRQTEQTLYSAQVALAAEVATAYVTLRSAAAQLEVVEGSLRTRQETLEITQWREQAGLITSLDTQQSLSALEQARASLPALQLTLEQTRNTIALLCGKTPGSVDALLEVKRPVPELATTVGVGIPADTLRQRPDVRAAEAALQAASARTQASERERFPSLSLSGSIGVEALKAGRLFDPAAITSSVFGSLTAPIFDAGRIRQQVQIQTAAEEQAFINYESTVLTALSEVENALVAERRTVERRAVLDRATSAAHSAATLAEQQYEAGQVDLLTVLDAQRTLLNLQQQQVTTLADLTHTHIQLYKALGGGWAAL